MKLVSNGSQVNSQVSSLCTSYFLTMHTYAFYKQIFPRKFLLYVSKHLKVTVSHSNTRKKRLLIRRLPFLSSSAPPTSTVTPLFTTRCFSSPQVAWAFFIRSLCLLVLIFWVERISQGRGRCVKLGPFNIHELFKDSNRKQWYTQIRTI